MKPSTPASLIFGRMRIDVHRRELFADGVRVELGSRSFDILLLLIEARGELVSKVALMRRIWSGVVIEENTLQSHIYALRNALGRERALIRTVSGRGYRFVGQLEEVERNTVPAEPTAYTVPGASRAITNLPSALSTLIGRSTELGELIKLILRHRLVTLVGAGGIGKTRLALEAARGLLPHFPDAGVWLTELAPLSDPGSIGAAVVAALGLRFSTPELSASRLGAAFGAKRMVLVLDNCEHLIDAAARFIEDLLRATSGLQVVTTSREPLGVEGEQVYQVAPLRSPPERAARAAEVLTYEAAQFFCTRVREADHTFVLDDARASAVSAICRCLDGLPLAIELAAPRAAALGVTTVAARLDRLFQLLAQGRRTSPPRHRALRATLEWSYQLLSEGERRVLRRLSIFSGGFTLEAACALAGDPAVDDTEVIDCIARLLAKSFIETTHKEVPVRYRLLQTTQAYLFEKLTQSDEDIDVCRRRHAEYFCQLLGVTAQAPLVSNPSLQKLDPEIDNVRAALAWSFAVPGGTSLSLELAVRSAPLWLGRCLLNECRMWMEKALARLQGSGSNGTRDEVMLRSALALTLAIQGASAEAILGALGEACELAGKSGEKDCYAIALYTLWFANYRAIDVRAMFAAAERLQREVAALGSEILISFAERLIGQTEQLAGDHVNARVHLERSIHRREALPRNGGAAHFVFDNPAAARSALANSLWLQGLPDQAAATAELSFQDSRATGDVLVLCHALLYCIHYALKVEDLRAADSYVTELMRRAEEVSSDVYHAFARGARGILMAKGGEDGAGLALLQAAMQEFFTLKHVFFYTLLGSELAEILARVGRTQDSHAVLDETMKEVRRGGAYTLLPELLRVKGDIYAVREEDGSVRMAESLFLEAIDLSRRQGALSFELRAAISLARLKHKLARDAEALQVLAPVYLRFREGFRTRDLQRARLLLEQLGWQVSAGTESNCRPGPASACA